MGAVEPGIRDLAREANFAAFTVLLRSGAAMTHVMWVDADDDHVLINTECTAPSTRPCGAIPA